MSHARRTLLLALPLALAVAGCGGRGNPSLSAPDNNFIIQAAAGGESEVALGNLALRKTSNPAIQQFAQRMVTDHTAMNRELVQIAAQKGVVPPIGTDPARVEANKQLSNLTGIPFDQQYMAQQAQDHQLTAALFRTEANTSQDAELRAFAQKYLPVIEAHGELAQQILQSVSVPADQAAPQRRSRR